MRALSGKYLPEQIIVQEILFQRYLPIKSILIILKLKYHNTLENYAHLFSVIKKYNLHGYVKKLCSKKRLDSFLNDEFLKELLFKISKPQRTLNNYKNILEQHDYFISKYRIERLLKYYRIPYFKTEYDDIKRKHMKIYQYQKNNIVQYCDKKGWNINKLNFKQVLKLYQVFEYEWLYVSIQKTLFQN